MKKNIIMICTVAAVAVASLMIGITIGGHSNNDTTEETWNRGFDDCMQYMADTLEFVNKYDEVVEACDAVDEEEVNEFLESLIESGDYSEEFVTMVEAELAE